MKKSAFDIDTSQECDIQVKLTKKEVALLLKFFKAHETTVDDKNLQEAIVKMKKPLDAVIQEAMLGIFKEELKNRR